jgi:hypothetical protein
MNKLLLVNLSSLIFVFIGIWRAIINVPDKILFQKCVHRQDGIMKEYDPYNIFLKLRLAIIVWFLQFIFIVWPLFRIENSMFILSSFIFSLALSVLICIGFGNLDVNDCYNPSVKPIILVVRHLSYDFFCQLLPMFFVVGSIIKYCIYKKMPSQIQSVV